MGLSLQQSKRRIKSIAATKKITKAMELVSTSKLKRVKQLNLAITPYKNEVENIMNSIVYNIDDTAENPYFIENKVDKKLIIVITSSLGLCGGYNSNMIKFIQGNINPSTVDIITIGSRGYQQLKNRGYNIVQSYDELPTFNVKEKLSTIITRLIMNDFINQKYSRIELFYTKYVNSLVFEPVNITLLPISKKTTPIVFKKQLLLEPTPNDVLNELIPFYLTTVLKTHIFEAIMSEQASRRNAMENATDNAQDLQDKLLLEYNKARQAAITQEITEISSSAEALS